MTERFRKLGERIPAPLHTMRMKMIIVIITALTISAVIAMAFSRFGELFIEKVLLDDERVADSQIELLLSFAEFVKENDIASNESEKFDEWLKEHGNASLTVFRESEKVLGDDETEEEDENAATWYLYNGSTTIVKQSSLPFFFSSDERIVTTGGASDGDVYSTYDFMVYPVRFSDGVRSVVIFNHIEQIYTTALSVLTLIIYCFSMLFIILRYNGRIIRRVNSLSEQVSVVSKGDISATVSMKGFDEIATLASDVEHMREVLSQRIISEQNAWRSNQELLTSISHDIRTPLTTLIGYSDMLSNGQYQNEEQFNRYLKSCREKAYQLKSLTDELFGYFLVFGTPEIKCNLEKENARILFEQLLGEPLADFRARGVEVSQTSLNSDVYINVDVMLVKRVFDNLFSNIGKYADFKKKLTAHTSLHAGVITVELVNHINKNNKNVESTKIGTKICSRLCEAMGVGYFAEQSGDVYTTRLTFPVDGFSK